MAKGLENDVSGTMTSLQEWVLKQGWAIDAAQSNEITAEGVKTESSGTKDGKFQAHEILAVAFNHWSQFSETLQNTKQDPFKKIGLDLSWLKPDPTGKDLFQVSDEFRAQVKKNLLGEEGVLLKKGREYQADFQQPLENPQNGTQLLRYAYAHTELKLLPLEDQKLLIDQYVDSLSLKGDKPESLKKTMKEELARLRQGTTLPKVVAQDAALQGKRMADEAEELRIKVARTKMRRPGHDPKKMDSKKRLQNEADLKLSAKKSEQAKTLLAMALQLDPENVYAHRQMARLHYEGEPKNEKLGRRSLIEAIRSEKSQMGQIELVMFLEWNRDPEIKDSWKFFDDKMRLLKREKELIDLHLGPPALYSERNVDMNYQHLVAAYQAGGRDDALMMKLAKDAKIIKDVLASDKALIPNEEERQAFESQLAGWVAKAGDPFLAHQILTEGSATIGDIAKTSPGKALALSDLYKSPDVWLNAAESSYADKQTSLLKAATRITQGRLCRQKIGEETTLVFVPDYFLKKDSDPVLQGKLASGELSPLDQVDHSERLSTRVKEIYDKTPSSYIDFPKQLDQEIEASQLALFTAEGPARDEAFTRLNELQMGRASLSVLDFFERGLSSNADYQELLSTTDHYIESVRKDPYRRDLSVEDTIAAIEKNFSKVENFINTHPELAEYLVPQLKVLRADLEVLRKDSQGSFGRWGFNEHIKIFHERLSSMGQPGVQHLLQTSPIFAKTRIKLAAGILDRDPRLFSEGVQDLSIIMEYSKLDAKKAAAMVSYASLQPTNSRLIFDLELDPNNHKVKELKQVESVTDQASIDTLKKSSLWKAKSAFFTEGDTASYTHLTNVCGELNKSWDTKGKNYSNFWSVPATQDATIEDLKKYNEELRALYGGPENAQVLGKIQTQINEENLKDNKGFQIRQEFGEGMASYQDLVAMDKTYSVLAAQNYQGVSADQVTAVRDFYLKRGEAYQKYLSEEIERIHEDEKKDAPKGMGASKEGWIQEKTGEKGPMGVEQVIWVGPKESSAKLTLLKNQAEFYLRKKELEQLSTADPAQAVKILQSYHKIFQGYEESHLEGLLSRQIEMVKSIPGDPGKDLEKVLNDFPWLTKTPSGFEKLKAYQNLQTKIDAAALMQSVRAKKEMIKKMADEVGTTDKVLNVIKYIDPFTPGDVDGKSRFLDTVKEYEKVEELLSSGDPVQINLGRTMFVEMEQSGNMAGLQSDYKTSASFNQFTIGVGIVIAAAVTGGAAAGFAGVLGGGALVQGLTMATVFTLSSRVYHAAIYDGETVAGAFANIAKDPLGFGEEVLLNWAMFGAIGKANKVFMGFFEKGVQEVAVKNLVAKGLLEEGTKITEELLVKNPALKLALATESQAVKQGFFTMALGKGGQFATEVLAFQGWEVAMSNYQLIKKGNWSVGKFGESFAAFLPDRVGHGAMFLLALKAGGVFSMPVTNFMQAKFTKMALGKLDKDFQKLQVEIDATEAAAVKYFEKGEGDINDILARYKDAALKRKALLEKLPPELLNPAAKALNELLLKQISLIESGIGPWEKIFGYGNPYGIKTTEAGIQKFADAQGPLLVKVLSEHPWVSQLRVSANGVIEFTYADPMTGQKNPVRLLSEGKIKADEIMAMQDLAMAKLDAQWGPTDGKAKEKGSPEKTDDTVRLKKPAVAQDQAMAAQPAEALNPKVDFGPEPTPSLDSSVTTGSLKGRDGYNSHEMNFADRVFQTVTIDNVTLIFHEAAGENGKTVYKMSYFGPKGVVKIYQGRGEGKTVPSPQHGKGVFEINVTDGASLEINGKDYTFYKPEVSTRELQAQETARTVARYEQARAEKARRPQTQDTTAVGNIPQQPVVMERGGKTLRQGDAVLEGAGGPVIVDSNGRVYQELPKGNLLFYPEKSVRSGKIGHFVRCFGEAGAVKIQEGGKGPFKVLEPGGKAGEKTSARHELQNGDVLLINGEKFVYHSPDSLRSEGEKRSLINTERKNLDSELKIIQAMPESSEKTQKYTEFKTRETAFEAMLTKENRTVEGVPFAEEMPGVTRTVAGTVFDGKVDKNGKELPLFNEDGSVNPTARRALRDQVVTDLYLKRMTISSDPVKTGEELNTVAVDSMIDLALSAKRHGIIDTPEGLSRTQFFRLVNELYLHKSPAVRISGAELTHVPMVVEGILGFLEAQNPGASISEKRVAFITALFHDAGKWDPEIRTQKGYKIHPHPFFNPTGKTLEVKAGESFSEAMTRHETEGILSGEQRGKIKMPGFLISVVVHHDSSAVFKVLQDLETEGVLQKGEAEKSWQAVEKHGMVSSWILNNSAITVPAVDAASKKRDIGVHSNVFSDPAFASYIKLFYELSNEMLEGKKLDFTADTKDARVQELRKIFKNDFTELDRAMLLGDHQGQIDISKYMGILATSPANKDASIYQVLLGGDRVNSVDGVLKTHSDEQVLLMPEAGSKAAEDFQKAASWLSQLDPKQPGLAQALLADSTTQLQFENWRKQNPDKPGTVEAWLKHEKVLGEGGKPNESFNDIKAAVEKSFYERFFIDGHDSLFAWEKPLPVSTGPSKASPNPSPVNLKMLWWKSGG